MKKLFLLIVLVMSCSTTHGVKVSENSKDASPDVSIEQINSREDNFNYCSSLCNHISVSNDSQSDVVVLQKRLQCLRDCIPDRDD